MKVQQFVSTFRSLLIFCSFGLTSITEIQAIHKNRLNRENKKFVILTASYNNIRYYKWNLDSIFNQTYPHWELVYIDDISTDGTREAVQAYINEKGFAHKVKFVANIEKCYCLKNYYREIHQIPDNKIIVTLDGDDAFLNNKVLAYLNEVYSNSAVWCTYGNFRYYPEPGNRTFKARAFSQKVIDNNTFRDCQWWRIHHLRSFYAGLFKNIKLEDLLCEDSFIKYSEDVAYMLPIIEQAGKHHLFIEKELYLYNIGNPLITDNTYKKDQLEAIRNYIHSKPKYAPLRVPPFTRKSI